MDASFHQEEAYQNYARKEGEEFYDSVQRLITRFQALDAQESALNLQGSSYGHSPYSLAQNGDKGVVFADGDERYEAQPNKSYRLKRSLSLGREAVPVRYRLTGGDIPKKEKVGAYITIHNRNTDNEVPSPSPFVRGSGVRRTFSGVTRHYTPDNSDGLDDNHSDNFRLVSHKKFVIPGHIKIGGDLNGNQYGKSRSVTDIHRSSTDLSGRSESFGHSERHSRSKSRENNERRSRSKSRDAKYQSERTSRSKSREARNRNRVNHDASASQNMDILYQSEPTEYVSTAGTTGFPLTKVSKKSKAKYNANYFPAESRYVGYSTGTDYDDHYTSEDSAFHTGYDSHDSTISSDVTQLNQRPFYDQRHVNIRDKHTRRMTNYDTDIVDYGIGPEPKIHLTKKGYKFLDLDVDVSGFRPEDIQIVTQGKLLQVIAKGTVMKKTSNGDADTRIYRELKRQFSLPEEASAEYLQGILSPGGVLQIKGPIGVSGNTKKLKRKRVKFHFD